MGHSEEEEERDRDEEEIDEGQGNGKHNGIGDMLGPSIGEAQSKVPTTGVKRKDKGKEPIGGVRVKKKV
jgi:hypothetical protein